VYVAGYALGRFFIERMRIDYAHTIAGLRVNEWVSIVLFAAATIAIATGRSPERPNGSPEAEGPPGPATAQASPVPSAEAAAPDRPR
jgi:prolipoprotein diacylglyceryltransferase